MALLALAFTFAGIGAFVVIGGGEAVGSLPWRSTPLAIWLSLALGTLVVGSLFSLRCGELAEGPVDPRPPHWALVLPAACLLLLVVAPRRFDSIAREDGLVEWIGAVATACGCVWALVAARRHRGIVRCVLVAAAIVMFMLTGEELSWLQRLGQYGTPDVLAGNVQGEANLHNLATDRVQALYYLATCVALVLLPFVVRWTSIVPQALRVLVPGPGVVVIAATSTAFAYARTGNVVHHVTLWTAIGVLWWWTRAARPAWILAALALTGGGQALMLVIGPELARPWAPDEYREMLLAVAIALWAYGVLSSTRAGASPARSRPVLPPERGAQIVE